MDENINHQTGEGNDDNSNTSLIKQLSRELLFTIDNVERSARLLNQHKGLFESRVKVLEQMIQETGKVNDLLRGLLEDVQSEIRVAEGDLK